MGSAVGEGDGSGVPVFGGLVVCTGGCVGVEVWVGVGVGVMSGVDVGVEVGVGEVVGFGDSDSVHKCCLRYA